MNYKETLDFLYTSLPMFQRQGKVAYKANLDNSIAFDDYLHHPHQSYKIIHVAGTNGKGSTSHMLASIFQEAGYKTALYTSPHLKDFRERIRVDGAMIKEDFVVDFVKKHKGFIKARQASFFEMTVFMAFEYFKSQAVDIAIIETGMGGRLDSTNVVNPDLSIITNISYDHTQFLGDTIEKIAFEKAGIIKEKIPVIIGESQFSYNDVFISVAQQKKAPIIFADKKISIDFMLKTMQDRMCFSVKKEGVLWLDNLEIDLLGDYQKNNVITVLCAIHQMQKKWTIPSDAIYKGLSSVKKNTQLLGRWQILDHNPLTIADTGHNKDGLGYVMQQIKNTAYKKLHIVWGMVSDKSTHTILPLLPKDAKYYFAKASVPRALSEKILMEEAQKEGLEGLSFSTVKEAILFAKSQAEAQDLIFIGGSTFVVADALFCFE